MFPNAGNAFVLKIDDDDYKVRLDKDGRIWSGGFKKINGFVVGAAIDITKDDADHYNAQIF